MNTGLIATGASGIAWTIVYLALVYRGIKDESYGMPLVPLALNFAWETVFSLVYPPAATGLPGTLINAAWMVCDMGIIYTYFKYSYQYFKQYYGLSKSQWITCSIFAFVLAFGIMLTGGPFLGQFVPYFQGDIFQGAIFIAYVQNLVISICFLLMIWQRRSSEGQSLTIAVFKCIGTGLTVGLYYLFDLHKGRASLMNIIIGATFLLDLIYIGTIYRQLASESKNAFRRF